ncbi:hypothetical protein Tco_1471175, partial [Tanacetum coccineum]
MVTPPPINTEATIITLSLPEITPFIALQLRVARLEQEMSEVKKTDHSADVLASIESQVPTAVVKYLGTKLNNALLKSVKNQESEKSPKEIIRAKKEQDEDAMDKEVADKVKDHKRKHDSDDDEDDDDDEGPSAGSNQGMPTKRRRSDSAASGSAQPPTKDDDQSSKKPRESVASATKQHPAQTSIGWQITDIRDAGADSSMHRSDPESEHSEQSSDDIPIPATPEPEWTMERISKKRTKNKAKNNKTGHGMEKHGKDKVKSKPKSERKKKLCKADLEGDKEQKIALSISKLKAARYLDFGLEELVPFLWVESEREYDISAAYDITHWWFRKKEFYVGPYQQDLNEPYTTYSPLDKSKETM